MQTSGTSDVADSPLLNLYPEYPAEGILRDSNPEQTILTLEYLNSRYEYPQRTTDLTVIRTGRAAGVKTYIYICPIIYGEGLGEFHKLTHQIPEMMRSAAKEGHAWIVGEGSGIKNHVHIMDLATLFTTYLTAILEGKDVPCGEQGVFFVENGEHSWNDVGEGIAKAGMELGVLKTDSVTRLTLKEATKRFHWGTEVWVESGFVSS